MPDDQFLAYLTTVGVGDVVSGTVADARRSGVSVSLDGCPGEPAGSIGALDLSWQFDRPSSEPVLRRGDRVRAEVVAVDAERRRIWLSRAATEHPQLWAFLKALRPGQRLSGTVAAIENFGVFVDLDDGPAHPTFPGVGFITIPELAWHRFDDAAGIVSVGEHITCTVLSFDTSNGEARLSLRATRPDPFLAFARDVRVGQVLPGRVTKLVPFGVFVQVRDGIEGLIHLRDLAGTPYSAVHAGDRITVIVTEIALPGRRLVLAPQGCG
ncbi:S1 RNA-binding domain-containing protein [Actinoplanes sp. NPDC023801]|uniref:S1 RNA-binding domain-containing protein n=1 Tax=Actinoplanes sp. NPDC023801 TaxID=3154595 RepID=UPI0033C4DA1F